MYRVYIIMNTSSSPPRIVIVFKDKKQAEKSFQIIKDNTDFYKGTYEIINQEVF